LAIFTTSLKPRSLEFLRHIYTVLLIVLKSKNRLVFLLLGNRSVFSLSPRRRVFYGGQVASFIGRFHTHGARRHDLLARKLLKNRTTKEAILESRISLRPLTFVNFEYKTSKIGNFEHYIRGAATVSITPTLISTKPDASKDKLITESLMPHSHYV